MIIAIALAVLVLLGVSVFSGAPYIPTRRAQAEQAVSLAKVSKDTVFVDLGSGDGAVILAAAQKGATAIGYEINPFLVLFSRYRLRSYDNAAIRFGSFWSADVSSADVVYIFGVTRIMKRLDSKLRTETTKPLLLISYGMPVPQKEHQAKEEPFIMYSYKPKQ